MDELVETHIGFCFYVKISYFIMRDGIVSRLVSWSIVRDWNRV